MELSYQEKGEYFRGLLILIGKDNNIDGNEKDKAIEIGHKFGFSKSFCEEAVNDFLENQFINMEPPRFSSVHIAEKFLEDAVHLSIIDNDLHAEELEWLENVAVENGLKKNILDEKIKRQILKIETSNDLTTNNK